MVICQSLISLIILNDTKANFIYPLLDKAFLNIKNNNPKLLDEGKQTVKLQFKLIEEIENSNNNKWLKQLIVQTLNKINLDYFDFNFILYKIPPKSKRFGAIFLHYYK